MVAATVRPLPGRVAPPKPEAQAELKPKADEVAMRVPVSASAKAAKPKPPRPGPDAIEPRRHHRIAKERDEIGARIDLHGLNQDRAQPALEAFILRAWDDGYRAVLVITGKGSRGDGVLRRRVPEWLAAPRLREVVAGISEAHRRHGGEGALYVALKRRPRT